jgi:hypothetical protein
MRDRLINLLYEAEGQVNNDYPTVEMIADYLVARNVVALPCNVGDIVYYLDGRTIVKSKVHCISFGGRYGEYSKGQIHIYDSDKDNITVKIERFGTSFFLTKDQAEQKLKELRENVNL